MQRAVFHHEALFYDGGDEFLAGTLPFIREGIKAGEAVLVAVRRENIGELVGELAGDAG